MENQEKNQKLFENIRKRYAGTGAHLIELSRRGDGNNVSYVIGDSKYEKILWEKDNQSNSEGSEFIGSSNSTRL